jgi:hypothetical protein
MRTFAWIGLMLIFCGVLGLGGPKKEEDDVDWLLNHATTAPSTRPATSQPVSPFEPKEANPEARPGAITLSNGERIHGQLSTTREKPIRIFDEEKQEYQDIPFALIASMEAKVVWEREEKEWHFKESGSDIKEYSGKTYPARELQYIVTLVNGQKITGGIVSPIYASAGQNSLTFVLNKRQKGEVGKSLKGLVYVKKVEFDGDKAAPAKP